MDSARCPWCKDEIDVEMEYDTTGNLITCPKCRNESQICYEVTWDGEEEFVWFYLEKNAPPYP